MYETCILISLAHNHSTCEIERKQSKTSRQAWTLMHNILARKSSATHYIIDLTLRASDNRPRLHNSSKACGDHLWLIKSLVTKPPFLSSGHLRPIERRVFHHWSSQVAEFDGLLYRWKCWTVTDSIHASTRARMYYVNNLVRI